MASFENDIFTPLYKDTDDKRKTRTIGLELECTITNPDCPKPDLSEDWDDEFPDESQMEILNDWINLKYMTTFPGIGEDGSEYEFVTDPESINYLLEGGSDDFKRKIQFLRENTKPYISDGTHVHVSYLFGEDHEEISKRVSYITGVFAVQMQKIFGRVSHWARPSSELYLSKKFNPDIDWRSNELIKMLVANNKKELRRVDAGSKHSMVTRKSQTVEFRAGKGSHAIAELLAWIQTAYNIVELAAKDEEEIDNTKLGDILQGKYIERYIQYIRNNPNRVITKAELEESPNSMPMLQIVVKGSNDTTIL